MIGGERGEEWRERGENYRQGEEECMWRENCGYVATESGGGHEGSVKSKRLRTTNTCSAVVQLRR